MYTVTQPSSAAFTILTNSKANVGYVNIGLFVVAHVPGLLQQLTIHLRVIRFVRMNRSEIIRLSNLQSKTGVHCLDTCFYLVQD